MSQPNNNQSRQPTSYPSPHSYPSPSMSAYAYPPPTQGQSVEPYRASPTGSHVSLPSLNLPPIRVNDGRSQQQPQQQQQQVQQQQQQQQQQPQQPQQQAGGPVPMGSPLPPPMNNMGQFYHNPGQSLPPPQHMNVTSDPNQPLRYPLPATDSRVMSGGRHKKEIKRRTKTGCLTCRKRRIKCDEAHPTCRNCQKSKRECLGYDPIFKSQPGPAAIQPAPSSAPSMQATSATSSPYPPPPQGYMPAGNHVYAPTLSAGVSSPGSSVEPYDYSAAIDPALEGAGQSQMQVPPNSYEGAQGFRPDLKGSLDGASPYSSGASDGHNHRGGASLTQSPYVSTVPFHGDGDSKENPPAYTSSAAKRTKIDDLLAVGGVHPPALTLPSSVSGPVYDEIKRIYTTVYAPGIDRFLETRWFTSRGLSYVLADVRLCEQFAALISRFGIASQPGDYDTAAATQSLEASVVWSLMSVCRRVAADPALSNGQVNYQESNDGVHDAAKRLEIFENLVSGQYLDAEPLPPENEAGRNSNNFDEQLRYREREFWRLMGRFLTLRDDEASSAKDMDDTLGASRSLLDSRENRDVVYSIAIIRHLGQRMAEFPDNLQQPSTNDEQDAKAKVFVAKRFIEDQSLGKGTTQVIQRLCGMAMRSWTVGR